VQTITSGGNACSLTIEEGRQLKKNNPTKCFSTRKTTNEQTARNNKQKHEQIPNKKLNKHQTASNKQTGS